MQIITLGLIIAYIWITSQNVKSLKNRIISLEEYFDVSYSSKESNGSYDKHTDDEFSKINKIKSRLKDLEKEKCK